MTKTLVLLVSTGLLLAQVISAQDGAPSPTLAKRRAMYMCKCTCFSTNSTVIPLFAPIDPDKPCLTCSRKFCLDQGLEICKGAKLETPDHDTGTGYEGDVWARCFQRGSYKDQTVVSFYILAILGLLAYALVRSRLSGWMQTYREEGPAGVYRAVAKAPWTTSTRS
ncbi:hypothetical protein K437DRAFT_170044 [Tilletiaria anomala UBC 951]|uniref:Uncharacterized protein n=1 Tax=Tilletiaria anomala (strain ATCC 24038 / CBS 436.72 / UBC 951) TaxID=1037660 RepID=A0A066VJY0_TILAU|nr:uncharacterized protein K437DRAFT_170044 [Tilletiaria anomala UBC 951]KDN41771.1 hypothetical protein K437DRAFT_170044 [Tilletiaria anomala UBC 951]